MGKHGNATITYSKEVCIGNEPIAEVTLNVYSDDKPRISITPISYRRPPEGFTIEWLKEYADCLLGIADEFQSFMDKHGEK
jgi:hypothetical protein